MKNLFTYKEIKEKIKSNDYNAEMILMHLLLNFEKLEQERDEARRIANRWRSGTSQKWTFPWEKGSE
jgi:hypothetical protein